MMSDDMSSFIKIMSEFEEKIVVYTKIVVIVTFLLDGFHFSFIFDVSLCS